MTSLDGSWVGKDPHEEARRLQAETLGWCVWWGPKTGRFFAITRKGHPPMLVEARTSGELIERMSSATSWTLAQRSL